MYEAHHRWCDINVQAIVNVVFSSMLSPYCWRSLNSDKWSLAQCIRCTSTVYFDNRPQTKCTKWHQMHEMINTYRKWKCNTNWSGISQFENRLKINKFFIRTDTKSTLQMYLISQNVKQEKKKFQTRKHKMYADSSTQCFGKHQLIRQIRRFFVCLCVKIHPRNLIDYDEPSNYAGTHINNTRRKKHTSNRTCKI